MIPNITRGASFHGAIKYLLGPGKANEHTDPHVVAGAETVTGRTPVGVLGPEAAGPLAELLAEPSLLREAGGKPLPAAGTVWHCSLAIKADDGKLGDELWRQVAQDFMGKMGWTDPATGEAAMPWVAIGHGTSKAGNDHIHLVVSMVKDDGKIADTRHDFTRAQTSCRLIETELELTPLDGEQIGVAERGLTPTEHSREAATGQEPERRRLERIVRAAAATADSETEFIGLVRSDGADVAPFYATGGKTVTGYKVRLVDGQRWFGGGKLARDLTLPRLRDTWQYSGTSDLGALAAWSGSRATTARPQPAGPVSDAQVTRAVGLIDKVTRDAQASGDLAAWAAVSHDLAGILSSASRETEGDTPGPLAAAAVAASRLGQLHRRSLDHSPRPRARMSGAARVGRTLGRTRGRAGTRVFMRQLVTTMYALAEAAKALRQARIAEKLLESVRTDLQPLTAWSTPQKPITAAAAQQRASGVSKGADVARRSRARAAAARQAGRGR